MLWYKCIIQIMNYIINCKNFGLKKNNSENNKLYQAHIEIIWVN